MSKLSSGDIKKVLATKYKCLVKNIIRDSKSKNVNSEIIRIFKVDSIYVEVNSGILDEKIISIVEIEHKETNHQSDISLSDFLSGTHADRIRKLNDSIKSMAISKKSKKPIKGYIFAVTELDNGKGGIFLIKKSLWVKTGYPDDQPQMVIDKLPDYIQDINESSINELYCDSSWTVKEVIEDLESYGLEYSNDIASNAEEYSSEDKGEIPWYIK